MRALITLGRERGYLTHADINDHLPDNVTPAAMDIIVSTFSDMGVAVYEQAPDAETLLLNDAATTTSDDQSDEEAEATLSTVDSEFGRTTDPVRLYMREMGGSELLTRAGEIAVAKRIESGLQDMIQAIAACPSVVSMILADVDRIVAGELRIDELVEGITEPAEGDAADDGDMSDDAAAVADDADTDTPDDADEASDDEDEDAGGGDSEKANAARLEQLTTDSLAIFARVRALFEQLPEGPVTGQARTAAIARMREDIQRELAPIRFTAKMIDSLCASVHNQVAEVRTLERSILDIAVERCGMPREAFIKSFPGNETDLDWTHRTAATSQQF
ncbi:RNA polymerase sigma factor RpoD, partial [Cupriavidus pauculus]